MNKRAMRKDFYMEIRRSLGRFLSIFFIVALGVAFFSGIRSAQPDMLATGDAYFDASNLMDIKAIGTMGITKDDITAIKKVDGVAYAEGGYSIDALCTEDENQTVFHVMSILPTMNQLAVTDGRLPEKPGECLVDNETAYKVGDTIRLESGTDTEITESLKTDILKVVGTGSSPCYISFGRGSTTIGTGSISGFLAVTESTFDMDVYTEAYVQVTDAKELEAYSDTYEDRTSAVIDDIEAITGERAKIRKAEITDEADQELADARKELEEGRSEAKEKLAEAEQELLDGERQLADGKNQIAEGEQAITQAKATLSEKQKELTDAKNQYYVGKKQLEDGKAAYNQGLAEYNQKKAEYSGQLEQGRAALSQARQDLDAGWANYNEANNQYQGLLASKGQLEAAIAGLEQQIQSLQSQIDGLDTSDPEYDTKKEALEAQITEAETKRTAASGQLAQVEGGITALTTQLNGPPDKVLPAIKAGLDEGETSYQSESQNFAASEAAFNQQMEEAGNTLAASKSQLDESEAQLTSAWSQITSGQSQIDSGWAQLREQEATLKSAKEELASKEPELADGRAEYEKAKKEAEEELQDAEAKIKDAEKEIAKIKNPKWYVFDRTTLPEYSGYGDNADRMKAIGQVFPVLFFLVAALISLTSMTRMVEEQRTQIGTMKAMGYGKFAIASKYLGYAFIATLGGSIFGVLVGEKVIPYIIIYAYGIMYHHMTDILTPYNMYYAVMSTLAAVACTMAATMLSCYRELSAQPAVLMRPPSPKKGKRVFMERITFIWKHLSFIWKATIRNLFRYKKRFFMTVFGIGGCMALILVGFGLRDSIFEIADVQYKEIQVYDGMAYLKEDVPQEDEEDFKTFLKKDKDIEQFLDVEMQNVTLVNGSEEREAYVCVPSDVKEIEDFVKFHDRITKEAYELGDEGVILSEKTAKLLDAKVGDTIAIKDTDNGNKEVTIADICENYMGHYMYMSPNLYEDTYGEKPMYNCIYFKMAGDSRKVLEDTGKEILSMDAVLNITYLHDVEKQLGDMLKSLNLVIVVLIVSAGMLAFVVLYNLNNINITERKRELATIKVLGFYDPEVSAYVYRENIILTFVGALAGVVMGMVLHRFIIETVEVDAAMFGRIINLPSYLYSVLFTFGFSLFVNWVMYFKLKRIDMVESLKSVE